MLLFSCKHDELCYLHPHTAQVRVDVDWSYFTKYEAPTGMTVTLFPDDGSTPHRTVTHTIDHAVMSLPVGTYHALVFNQSESEFGSFTFRDMDSAESAVVAVERSSRWYSRTDTEPVATESEWLGVGNYSNAEVTQDMIDDQAWIHSQTSRAGEPVIATVVPHNILHTVIVRIHTKGIYNLRSARAALTGMSEGHMLTRDINLNSKVTYLLENFKLEKDGNDPARGYIEARISCFGLPDDHRSLPQENELSLELLLVDNKTILTYDIPVGDRFVKIEEMIYPDTNDIKAEAETGYSLLIELFADDPIDVPDVKPTEGSSAGFDAIVDDWEEEIRQDIPM